jgi:primosomal protein N' (replication factor Y)
VAAKSDIIFQVALGAPVMRLFDYLPPDEAGPAGIRGQRIHVPFGKKTRVGVLVAVKNSSPIPQDRLRHALRILDADPVLDEKTMALIEWAADYYHYPPGEVFAAALPRALRTGNSAVATETCWKITPEGLAGREALGQRAPVQTRILSLAALHNEGITKFNLADISTSWRKSIALLVEKGWLEQTEISPTNAISRSDQLESAPQLTPDQRTSIDAINAETGFSAFLLEGVTGSGKTEVYLQCIQEQLTKNRQCLVLVPEIGLTPQLIDRFRRRLDTQIVAMHSGLSDGERLRAWSAARDGSANVIIGTRSAVFAPLARPGLIVVDEEHDGSLKQQDGFRYSARDIAVWRARQLDVPVILGSATPSFETLENANAGRYRHLSLPNRPGSARPPKIRLIDLRTQPAKDGLTEPLRNAIATHLEAGGQVLLFLDRRGFAPALLCTSCGYVAECGRCDSRMVVHHQKGKLRCHHCGSERKEPSQCPECHEGLLPVGQGTERLEGALRSLYPDHGIARIDRDTTRQRGEIQRRLESVRSGDTRILLGTRMLTKGHDFPNVTLVGIIDADQGLFGTDFRSSERLAQTIVQVSGRAGRGERPGEVHIQTLFPDHPLLTVLVQHGYARFAHDAMLERHAAGWPPFCFLALLRAESPSREPIYSFLNEARNLAAGSREPGIQLLGPAPAPMERRSGRFRGQLLVRANNRAGLQRFLGTWRTDLDGLRSGRQARWSLDIDPVELF